MRTSPFPGMDPYLERHWGDVHVGMLTGITAALQPHLPPNLQALCEVGRKAGTSDGKFDKWAQIIDLDDGDRVVTAIEVLSPSNKSAGRDNRDYRRKVRDYISGGVNVVEIDLLRSPHDRLAVPVVEVQPGRREPPTTYFARVGRAVRRQYWEVYPTPLRDPLPTIAIPCRRTDDDVPLPLQAVLDRVYQEGGHHHLNYARPLRPRLPKADAAWAAGRIAAWAR